MTYSLVRAFVEIKVRKKWVAVRVFATGVADPLGIVEDIRGKRWPHDLELRIDTPKLVDYVMPFVEASYRRELSR